MKSTLRRSCCSLIVLSSDLKTSSILSIFSSKHCFWKTKWQSLKHLYVLIFLEGMSQSCLYKLIYTVPSWIKSFTKLFGSIWDYFRRINQDRFQTSKRDRGWGFPNISNLAFRNLNFGYRFMSGCLGHRLKNIFAFHLVQIECWVWWIIQVSICIHNLPSNQERLRRMLESRSSGRNRQSAVLRFRCSASTNWATEVIGCVIASSCKSRFSCCGFGLRLNLRCFCISFDHGKDGA